MDVFRLITSRKDVSGLKRPRPRPSQVDDNPKGVPPVRRNDANTKKAKAKAGRYFCPLRSKLKKVVEQQPLLDSQMKGEQPRLWREKVNRPSTGVYLSPLK